MNAAVFSLSMNKSHGRELGDKEPVKIQRTLFRLGIGILAVLSVSIAVLYAVSIIQVVSHLLY